MILVFILLGILIFVSMFLFIILLSTLKIKIINLEIGNESKKNKNEIYEFKLELYFLNKIKLYKNNINNQKLKKIYNSKQLEKIDFNKIKKQIPLNIQSIKLLKKLKINIEDLNLNFEIGVKDEIILTSYLVVIITTLISIILPHLVKNNDIRKCYYNIQPFYTKDKVSLHLDLSLSIKIVDIVNTICSLIKKGRINKDERTSNRRSYEYCHEFN